MNRRPLLHEFLAASLAHAVCLGWAFHASLLQGRVDALQARPPSPEAFVDMSEMVYELEPTIATQTRLVHQGVFPAWSPHSQGGTPLIGKMQNGAFAPHHLPLYVLPLSWLPWLLTLAILIKAFLAFSFSYLYARCVGLKAFPAFLAGVLFEFCNGIQGQIFSWGGIGLHLPLLLLLAELHLRGWRRLSCFLWPWAVALPFLSGHFESAVWINIAAGAYFCGRLALEEGMPVSGKLRRALGMAGLSLLGALAAGVQIYPAWEYVNLSYNKIWHDPRWFGFWDLETVGKHLSGEDGPMLALGLGGLLGFVLLIRRGPRGGEPLGAGEFVRKAAAAAALALALAALAQLGLEDSFRGLNFAPGGEPSWPLGLSLFFLALWAWSLEHAPGPRVLGWVLIGSFLILHKMPVLSNLLLHAPVLGDFHNTNYRWDFALAQSVLGALALQRAWESGGSWTSRLKTGLRAWSMAGVLLLAYAGSQPLKDMLARGVPTAVAPSADPRAGGVMGPERILTRRATYAVSGWAPAGSPVVAVAVALASGNQVKAQEDATPTLRPSGGRLYFHASLPLAGPGNFQVLAQVQRADGTRQMLRGPGIEASRVGRPQGLRRAAAALLLATPLLLFCGPAALRLAYASLLISGLATFRSAGLPAGEIPYRSAGIDGVKADPDLFRVASLQYNFLQADYPNMYGLSDIRTGGDNLDLLPMLYFSHLCQGFLADPSPGSFDIGLRLWGLANVRYLLERAGAGPPHAGLEPRYAGPELSVLRNGHFRPRALFFEKYDYLSLGDWKDWGARGSFLRPIAEALALRKLDPGSTLLLHDPPSRAAEGGAPSAAAGPSLRVEEYGPARVRLNIETPRPGFVFLSDNDFPGWEASVNGRKADILRSWLTFRAVQVPAGSSRVVFAYRPFALWLFATLSAGLALGWAWAYRWARPGRGPDPLPAAQIAQGKKKRPPPAPEPDPVTAGCAQLAQALVLSIAGAMLLFWTLWSAFVYGGGAQACLRGGSCWVNWAACALLVAAAAAALKDWRASRAVARPGPATAV